MLNTLPKAFVRLAVACAFPLAVACSSASASAPSNDGGARETADAAIGDDAGSLAAHADADAGPSGSDQDCTYPSCAFNADCPTYYVDAVHAVGQTCPDLGVVCCYPAAGPPMANGCHSTPSFLCSGDGGAGDAGAGTWISE